MNRIHVDFDDAARAKGALRDFGFDDSFLLSFAARARPGEVPARIVSVRKGGYLVVVEGEDGPEELEAEASGGLEGDAESQADFPAVGDWVILASGPGRSPGTAGGGPRSGPLVIRRVLPRRSAFVRKAPGDAAHDRVEAQVIAANVDLALVVSAAGADWNPRRVERYLALAIEAGVRPIVAIAKADLAEDGEALLDEARGLAPGLDCVLVCAPEGRGLDLLRERLAPGTTAVLLGSSGAGKSTLLNALAGRELARTGAVRADDQRGRHTTSARQLYRLDSGALVVDTPGLREVQLWVEEESVRAVFAEIADLARSCRFRDCGHGAEPGCAVREALEAGRLDRGRYEGYLKLVRELRFLETREDPAARRAEADRWKAINKSMRGYSKERRAHMGRAR